MAILKNTTGLFVDFYELTMAQGHFFNGVSNRRVSFDYFFREIPFRGGYVVFAGLEDLLDALDQYTFDAEDCEYLRSVGLRNEFIDYLRDLKLKLTVHAPREGEIVFPNEPIVRVEGGIIEAQIVETILLNILNFESLIATKAARIRYAAGDKTVSDFGLRRAQGLAGIYASRAAIIGGADTTSNVFSARQFGLKPAGTQAHSWIQLYENELDAFRQFAKVFPETCILLVDTYNTLRSGVPNAITVAKEMESRGERLRAIRLDSGDLAYLSKRARKMLDDEGLQYVGIIASNQLDEYIIRSLQQQGAPIDGYGIGTRLVTGKEDAALDGVYKISMADGKPLMKLSENVEKMTLPGVKKIYRYRNGDGIFNSDAILLENEKDIDVMYHPYQPEKNKSVRGLHAEELLGAVMKDGERCVDKQSPYAIAGYVKERLDHLSEEHKRFEFPHIYKVGISKRLLDERTALVNHIRSKI
jgi:nicotinate phosphoribosyltransferase